jgi:hypothetical protein
MYMVVVQRPMPAAVASRCCRRRFQQLAYACGTKSRRGVQADSRDATQVFDRGAQADARGATQGFDRGAQADARGATQGFDRGAQADARGATQVLDRGVQAVARGAARCLLHVLGRSAKTDACGRSFAILSTQVSTVGLRLRHNRLTCGTMPPKRVRSPSDATCGLQRCPKTFKGCWFAAWRSTGLYLLRTQKKIIVASKQPEGTSPMYSFGLPKSENMPGSAAALMRQRRMSSYSRLM